MGAMTEIHYRTISELRQALATKEISSVELTEALLARIEKLNPNLNAFRLVCPKRALTAARAADEQRGSDPSPLLGIPFATKDLFDVAGLPTSAGCHLLENEVAENDCTAVARLAAAGMVLVGKTNTVQFAYGGVGINHDHGTPVNPWCEEHHAPGGSSSGSAVAVASGLAPMALGSDTGGSVRIPAALCGISGLKTTVGQISRAGVYPLSWSLDSVGPLARSIEDTALVYEALQGADPADPSTAGRPEHAVLGTLNDGVRGLRLAYPETVFWESVDAEIALAVRDCQSVFRGLGANIVSIDFDQAEEARTLNHRGLIIAAEAWTLNRALLEQHFDELDPVVAYRMIKGKDIPAEEYLHFCVEQQRLRAAAARVFDEIDALLVPTTAIAARPVAEIDAGVDAYSEHNLAYLRNTAIGNILNLSAVSVPCGVTENGLPIGLMIYAKSFGEDMALRVAQAYQQATDWHRRTPDLGWAGESAS